MSFYLARWASFTNVIIILALSKSTECQPWASYENLWRAKTGTVAPKTVDWSPIVRGISISSHILARLLIDDGERKKGLVLVYIALSHSLVLSLSRPIILYPFMPKSHYSSIFIYTWNPKYDKNRSLPSLPPSLSLHPSLSLSFNDCALIEHSINVPAIERPPSTLYYFISLSLFLTHSLTHSYPNL